VTDMVMRLILPAIVGACVLLLLQIVGAAVGWGKAQAFAKGMFDRLERVERHLGIEDGKAAFIRVGECPLVTAAVAADLKEFSDRIQQVEREVHEIRKTQLMRGASNGG